MPCPSTHARSVAQDAARQEAHDELVVADDQRVPGVRARRRSARPRRRTPCRCRRSCPCPRRPTARPRSLRTLISTSSPASCRERKRFEQGRRGGAERAGVARQGACARQVVDAHERRRARESFPRDACSATRARRRVGRPGAPRRRRQPARSKRRKHLRAAARDQQARAALPPGRRWASAQPRSSSSNAKPAAGPRPPEALEQAVVAPAGRRSADPGRPRRMLKHRAGVIGEVARLGEVHDDPRREPSAPTASQSCSELDERALRAGRRRARARLAATRRRRRAELGQRGERARVSCRAHAVALGAACDLARVADAERLDDVGCARLGDARRAARPRCRRDRGRA